MDPNVLYRPSESKLKAVKKVDYLGSSRVIAAVDQSDTFIGFKGPHVRKALQYGNQLYDNLHEKSKTIGHGTSGQRRSPIYPDQVGGRPLERAATMGHQPFLHRDMSDRLQDSLTLSLKNGVMRSQSTKTYQSYSMKRSLMDKTEIPPPPPPKTEKQAPTSPEPLKYSHLTLSESSRTSSSVNSSCFKMETMDCFSKDRLDFGSLNGETPNTRSLNSAASVPSATSTSQCISNDDKV